MPINNCPLIYLLLSFYEVLVVRDGLRKSIQNLNQPYYLLVLELLVLVSQLLGIREQDFHSSSKPFDLDLTVEPAFITSNAIEDSRNIVKFIFYLCSKSLLLFICSYICKQTSFVEGDSTLPNSPIKELKNVTLCILIFDLADTCCVIMICQLILHSINCPNYKSVNEMHVPKPILIQTYFIRVHLVIWIAHIVLNVVVIM